MSHQQLRELVDKLSISCLIMTYVRVLDRFDEILLRSIFYPGIFPRSNRIARSTWY